MRGGEAVRDVYTNLDNLLRRQRSVSQPLAQGHALEQLHDGIRHAGGRFAREVVDSRMFG